MLEPDAAQPHAVSMKNAAVAPDIANTIHACARPITAVMRESDTTWRRTRSR